MTEFFGPRTIGKYEVLSVLGKGGMGVVYKGRDPLIDRPVAIKTILSEDVTPDEHLLARLRMEAKSAGRLQHPNIVMVYEFGQQDELSYLVMEYVEGASLSRIVSSGARLPLNTKFDLVHQLCDALAYAHEHGVVHRDIKPSNICVTSRGEAKILDFGLARFDETRLTRTGMASGTPSYMSPERLAGEGGPSDDIFAMGAVAYEIFTGQQAFPGVNFREVAAKILSGNHPVPPSQVADIPQELDAVIRKATARDKRERYATAAALGAAFREVQHNPAVQKRIAAEGPAPSGIFRTFVEAETRGADTSIDDISDTMQTAARPAVTPRPPDHTPLPFETIISGEQPAMIPIKAPAEEKPAPTVVAPRTPNVNANVGRALSPPEEPRRAESPSYVLFWSCAAALVVASALTTVAAKSGPSTLLAVYAASVAAWFFVVREGDKVSFRTVALMSLAMQIAASFQTPLTGAALAGDLANGPWYALLLAGWTASGGALLVRRAVIVAAILAGAWCLRDDEKPRIALAFATFPLLAIGTTNASFAVLAAALLAAAYAAIEHKRSGLAAVASTLAAGIAAPAVAAVPVFYEASWAMFIFLAALLVTAFVPRFILPTIGGWSGMIKGTVAGSPLLAFLDARVESLLHAGGVATKINGFFLLVAKRGQWNPFAVSDGGLALGVVYCTAIVAIIIAAHGAKKTAAALADALGLMLLVSMTRDPMLWLLPVPFAIAGNRRLWLLLAIGSPILWLGTSWTFYAASLVLPAIAFAAIKLQETSAKPAAVPSTGAGT